MKVSLVLPINLVGCNFHNYGDTHTSVKILRLIKSFAEQSPHSWLIVLIACWIKFYCIGTSQQDVNIRKEVFELVSLKVRGYTLVGSTSHYTT